MAGIADTLRWFQEARPTPNIQQETTQIGVHFEEVKEMLDEITPVDLETNEAIMDAKIALQHLSDWLKTHPGCVEIKPENRKGYLDALVDQLVTGVGCAHAENMKIVGGLNEVNRSNFSKFDPKTGKAIVDENGKITKGPDYSPPDLTPFI